MTKDAQKLLRHIIDGAKSQNSATVEIDISKIDNIPNIGFAQKKLLNELETAGVISGYQANILGEVFVYLTSDGLEYFDDLRENRESSNMVFNVSGGQVNITNDNGSINAIINDSVNERNVVAKTDYKAKKEPSLPSNTKAEKIFISYSWTPDCNKKWVEQLVHRLESDGMEVVIDFKDLKLGHDKYAFMERTVNDDTIKKVLIICNRAYKEKADGRIGGVGDESAVITSQMFGNVRQEKFIPVVNEFDENGKPFLPNYLASRMYANLTDFEKGYEELLNSINEVNEKEWVVKKNNDFGYDFVINGICDELRAVLQAIEPNSKITRYYFDYEILKEKGVIKIITDELVNVDYDMKKNICQYLWKKTFIDAQKDIDFCYIYRFI